MRAAGRTFGADGASPNTPHFGARQRAARHAGGEVDTAAVFAGQRSDQALDTAADSRLNNTVVE